MKAVSEAANSPVDMVRAMEGFLAKYPNSVQRVDIYRTIARGAIEMRDDDDACARQMRAKPLRGVGGEHGFGCSRAGRDG